MAGKGKSASADKTKSKSRSSRVKLNWILSSLFLSIISTPNLLSSIDSLSLFLFFSITSGWTSIPCRSNSSTPSKGKLRYPSRSWCPCLLGCRPWIPGSWNPWISWKRCSRQQKDSNHSSSLTISYSKWWRIEQTLVQCYDCSRWCFTQHSFHPSPQKDWKESSWLPRVLKVFLLTLNPCCLNSRKRKYPPRFS